MNDTLKIDLDLILYALLAMFGLGLILSLFFLGWVIWRVKRIHLPEGADFLTALRATPLSVVILLDLLDFSMDIFSAPFTWILLGYLGLQPLRAVTVIEAAIPGTQLIPSLTIAWIVARLTSAE
ncbi:MAG: hypothetical protein JXA78_10860 [Anaerolineales bacterium]|nr:hypothetical protein [Anaerolineales bacterium]